VSDPEPSSTGSSSDLSGTRDDDLAGLVGGERPEREGLPRTYRMRADSHYVEQLESRRPVPTIRLLATRQIETPPLTSMGLSPLIESVTAHGIPAAAARAEARGAISADRRPQTPGGGACRRHR
jgi:hypothetical protein